MYEDLRRCFEDDRFFLDCMKIVIDYYCIELNGEKVNLVI